ncbi:MAG: ribbon-helix-helix protein, CopG family [Opitutales bacterium]
MARPKGSSTRAIGMTQISISLPENLVAIIDDLARNENRNRSNYIVNTLSNLAKEAALAQAESAAALAESKRFLK